MGSTQLSRLLSGRLAAIGLAIVLVFGVGAAIVVSVSQNVSNAAVVQMHGVIGSEKLPFFSDAKVQAALKRGGFEVTVSTAGSRQIASMDLSQQDFAFPAGAPAGQKIKAAPPSGRMKLYGAVVDVPRSAAPPRQDVRRRCSRAL